MNKGFAFFRVLFFLIPLILWCGGSSCFISDRKEMEETFGSELDRMAVPVVSNLSMTLEFLQPVEFVDVENPVAGLSSGLVLHSPGRCCAPHRASYDELTNPEMRALEE